MQTFGFDYAYGITIDKVNQALASNLAGVKMPIKFGIVDQDSGTTVTMDAVLAPWQIVPGGQLRLLHLSIPFSDGYLALEGGALANGSFDVTDVSVIVEIELGWLGAGSEPQAQGGGNNTELVFDPSSVDPDNPGYVALIKLNDPDGNLSDIAQAVLSAYVIDALVANKSNLQYILANINPKPENLASWLQPVSWDYYYIDHPPTLCFLCMLSSAPLPAPGFDTSALGASDCSVLIAQSQFFGNVVLPGVQKTYPSGKFVVSTDAGISTISNQGDFDLGSVTASSLTLSTSPAGDGLAVSASGGGDLKFLFGLAKLPNASYSWSVASINPQSFSNGRLSFASDPNPVIHQDHTIHWYDWALLAVLGITNVAGLVSAIDDAVSGFHDQLQSVGIATINSTVQSATGGTVVNLQNLVDWKLGQEQLSVVSAGLAGALHVTGNFK